MNYWHAATVDNQTLMAHINHCIKASEILGVDHDLKQDWKKMLARIPPVRVGKDGTIMEWKDGMLVSVSIYSKLGNPCRLRYMGKSTRFETEAGREYSPDFEFISTHSN